MKKYVKASPDAYGFYTDEELEEFRRERDDFYAQREANKDTVMDFTPILDMYDWEIDCVTREQLGGDYHYHTLLKSVRDAEKYNYHSDYWGSADSYQDDAVDVMDNILSYIDNRIVVNYDDGSEEFILKGLLIDNQYNSHLKFLVEPVE